MSINFVSFFFFFFATLCGIWDLSSPPGMESMSPAVKVWSLKPLDTREVPIFVSVRKHIPNSKQYTWVNQLVPRLEVIILLQVVFANISKEAHEWMGTSLGVWFQMYNKKLHSLYIISVSAFQDLRVPRQIIPLEDFIMLICWIVQIISSFQTTTP